LGFGAVKHEPPPKTIEQQAGFEAGLTPEVVAQRRAITTREQQQKEWEAWSEQKRKWDTQSQPVKDIRRGIAHWLSGVPNIEYLQAWWEKDWKKTERIAESWEYGIWKAAKYQKTGFDLPSAFTTGYLSAPMTQNVIIPSVLAVGFGAGIGALKATTIGGKTLLVSRGVWETGKHAGKPIWELTVGGAVEKSIFGYGAYETGKSLIEDPFGTAVQLAVTMNFVIPTYRAGYRFGYGRTEAYLYKIHTYKPGTPEYIRFEQALKVGRILEGVKSHKMKPLDFAKDIIQMDKTTADQFLSYYAAHKGVVGGSAASYTQIVGARPPRDVDYFMQRFLRSTDPLVKSAKRILPTKTKAGEHLIDIHGEEMYKPGLYHRFGFVSKRPVKIEGIKYFKAGEQLFRKGVASVVEEVEYRWFKDIPDFVTHAKSLIGTLKEKTWNPFAQMKAAKAETVLDIFLHPSKSPSYGKPLSSIGKFFKTTTKPVEPIAVTSPFGVTDYLYPKSAYPSYGVGVAVAGYYPSTQQPYDVPPIGMYEAAPIDRYVSPPVVEGYPQSYKPPKLPLLYPPSKPPSYPLYKPPPKAPPYKPSKLPPYKPPKIPPLYPPSKPPLYPPYKPPPKAPPYKPSKLPPYKPPKMPLLYPPSKPPSYPPYKTPPEKPPKRGTDAFSGMLAVEDQQGYAVMVKDRYIVHGKKKYEERFIKLSKYPLTKADAMGFGATVTNESAAATFYIKPIKGQPQKPSIPIVSWGMLSNLFYKRDDKFIERTENRINTIGEINEISARGWVAQRRKLHPKPKKIKTIRIAPRDLRSAVLSDKFFKIPNGRSLF